MLQATKLLPGLPLTPQTRQQSPAVTAWDMKSISARMKPLEDRGQLEEEEESGGRQIPLSHLPVQLGDHKQWFQSTGPKSGGCHPKFPATRRQTPIECMQDRVNPQDYSLHLVSEGSCEESSHKLLQELSAQKKFVFWTQIVTVNLACRAHDWWLDEL